MCRLFLFLSLLGCELPAIGQSHIQGQIQNFHPTYLNIYLSQNESDVSADPYRLDIEEDGRFNVTLSTPGSGFATFYHYGAGVNIRFWLSPGSNDEIFFDQQDPIGSFRFEGTNAAANALLNSGEIKRTEYYKDEPWVKEMLKVANTKTLLMTEVDRRRQKEQLRWDDLKASGQMSALLYTTLSKETDYFWSYLLLDLLTDKGVSNFTGVESLRVDQLNDTDGRRTRYYFHYLQQHFEQIYPEADHMERSEIFKEKLDKALLEPFWAHYLGQHAVLGDRHHSLVPALIDFEGQYPNSVFLDMLKSKIDPLEDKYLLAQEPITADMEIFESPDDFASIEEVIERYKGEVLYFDMWASWCGPCIQEFKVRYKKPLNEFIEGKPVKVIYLSMDRDEAEQKWIAAVKRNRLNSVNLRFSGDRSSGLLRYLGIGPNQGFGIPRYFIVNKEGELVNAAAPSPSDKEKLYAELARYL
ncbi:MAG: TlpA family protein disulfide reductase [Roseivirga sp.]|nr:TlpA family protein disulfide reductase [Roseivirga sp.]